jgi:hypothetical protein
VWDTIGVMDEKTKENLKEGSKHVLHGLEDAAVVIGHTAVGAVQGAADGVQHASSTTKARENDTEEST